MIQDHLEDFIEVFVGNAKKIDPAILVEDKIDFLIIGDHLTKEVPSLEIQNWLLKYSKISKTRNQNIKTISGFYVAIASIQTNPFWVNFLYDCIMAEIRYPPILSLKLKRGELALEKGTGEKVKKYSNKFIEFFIENNEVKREKK